jgi:predicted esterase
VASTGDFTVTSSPELAPPEPRLASLNVPGFSNAVVALPTDREPGRTVVVVVHGLGDWPERHCEAWRNVTCGRAFILCPRGAYAPERSRKDDVRYTHPGGVLLRRHIDAALAALATEYGDDVDIAHPVLAGFSLGATEVALVAQADPGRFSRVAVLEGGLDVWFGATIHAFASGGGQRVLFGCGSSWCTPPAKAAIGRIVESGVEANLAFAAVGHTIDAPLQDAIRGHIGWLLDGSSNDDDRDRVACR